MSLDQRAQDLAARVAAYCQEHTLELGGLAARLAAGEALTDDVARELCHYCDTVRCLTLGGLVDEVWALRQAFWDLHKPAPSPEDGGLADGYDAWLADEDADAWEREQRQAARAERDAGYTE